MSTCVLNDWIRASNTEGEHETPGEPDRPFISGGAAPPVGRKRPINQPLDGAHGSRPRFVYAGSDGLFIQADPPFPYAGLDTLDNRPGQTNQRHDLSVRERKRPVPRKQLANAENCVAVPFLPFGIYPQRPQPAPGWGRFFWRVGQGNQRGRQLRRLTWSTCQY